ncbi:MAG: cytochrome c oxidase assembly protein [Acidimicrobiia bacterium]
MAPDASGFAAAYLGRVSVGTEPGTVLGSTGTVSGWHPHLEVWVLLLAVWGAYRLALGRLGPRLVGPGRPVASRGQRATFALGLLALWLGADWPIHDISERALYSAHMGQHLIFSLVAPPLLLLGTPAWLARELLGRLRLFVVAHWLTTPMVALLLFNGVMVLTHWPDLVDLTLRSEPLHLGAHVALVASALVMWSPVLAPLAELARLSAPAGMLYLFLQSLLPTVPASFLTFAESTLYRFYDTVPRIYGISAVEDQRIAGLLMKLGGGMLLWSVIAVLFFRWHAQEEAATRRRRQEWRDLERQLGGAR